MLRVKVLEFKYTLKQGTILCLDKFFPFKTFYNSEINSLSDGNIIRSLFFFNCNIQVITSFIPGTNIKKYGLLNCSD